jgi:hypothetical protein
MATTPPEEPSRSYGYTAPVARMPIPGNAELAVWLLVWFVIFLIWIISDEVTSGDFAFLTVILTVGYMLSRGIAKASRVLEQ